MANVEEEDGDVDGDRAIDFSRVVTLVEVVTKPREIFDLLVACYDAADAAANALEAYPTQSLQFLAAQMEAIERIRKMTSVARSLAVQVFDGDRDANSAVFLISRIVAEVRFRADVLRPDIVLSGSSSTPSAVLGDHALATIDREDAMDLDDLWRRLSSGPVDSDLSNGILETVRQFRLEVSGAIPDGKPMPAGADSAAYRGRNLRTIPQSSHALGVIPSQGIADHKHRVGSRRILTTLMLRSTESNSTTPIEIMQHIARAVGHPMAAQEASSVLLARGVMYIWEAAQHSGLQYRAYTPPPSTKGDLWRYLQTVAKQANERAKKEKCESMAAMAVFADAALPHVLRVIPPADQRESYALRAGRYLESTEDDRSPHTLALEAIKALGLRSATYSNASRVAKSKGNPLGGGSGGSKAKKAGGKKVT